MCVAFLWMCVVVQSDIFGNCHIRPKMSDWFMLYSIVFIIVTLFYCYVRHRQSYWSRHGIAGPAPYFLLGNMVDLLLRKISDFELDWLRKYGKVYGIYMGLRPVPVVADPVLIKQVLVKDFPTFIDRSFLTFYHEIWSKNLFLNQGDDWKRIRSIISPTFTSGKLHGMSGLMKICVENLCDYLKEVSNGGSSEFDAKKVIAGFTIDVIASTAFATNTNSNALDEKERSSNAFLANGMRMFRPPPHRPIAVTTMPLWFNNLFGINHPFGKENFEFFTSLTRTIVRQRRRAKDERRNDFVQLLVDASIDEMELKNDTVSYDRLTATDSFNDDSDKHQQQDSNGRKQQLTENEIIAQCIIFFVAGFETTATTLTYTLYELAVNPTIQDRLVNELNQALEGVTEDSEEYFDIVLHRVPYLEAVIKETLRKYPPDPRLFRTNTKDGYQLGTVQLHKNQPVIISVYAVHHLPEYYPEPERYNPERFMPENKHLLVPYTYLPFGDGPRNCIGMRFAYQEMKLCLAKLLTQFRFTPTKHTKIPLEFGTKSFFLLVSEMPLCVEQR